MAERPLKLSRPSGSEKILPDILVTEGPRGVAVWITDHSEFSVNGDCGKVRDIYGEIEEWYHTKGAKKDFPYDQMVRLVKQYFEQN